MDWSLWLGHYDLVIMVWSLWLGHYMAWSLYGLVIYGLVIMAWSLYGLVIMAWPLYDLVIMAWSLWLGHYDLGEPEDGAVRLSLFLNVIYV